MKGNSQLVRIAAIGILLILVFSMVGTGVNNSFSIGGYSSAFQGPKAKFYGIQWDGSNGQGWVEPSGQWTSSSAPSGTSLHQFDTVLHFDPDASNLGMPKIHGEMTTVFLPDQSLSFLPSWLPISWLQNNGLVQNPQQTYPGWNISGLMYYMERYAMRFYITFSGEWNGLEDPGPICDAILRPHVENIYQSVGVWIEFDLTPSWYIEGGGIAYFAIAKMQLSEESIKKGKTLTGEIVAPRTTESVSPYSRLSPVYMYYGAWGSTPAEQEAYSYQGKKLNPSYFRDKVYVHVDLNNFGVYADSDNIFWSKTRGDVATFAFDLQVFVIGEYTVQDIQDNPDQYGRFTPQGSTWNWGTWFSNSLWWLIPAAIFVLILIFAPWLLLVIISLIFGSRKSGGGKG